MFKKELTLTFNYSTLGTKIIIDMALVQQIIQILLSNVVKYALDQPFSTICIELNSTNLFVSISDNGIGIPAEETKKIFDLFYRAGNVNTERGLGLGLNIAKVLVEAMGGEIWAKSAGINQGSMFSFYIPLPQSV